MKDRTIANFALSGVSVFVVTALTFGPNPLPASAEDQPDTVTLVIHANKAADAYNQQQWAQAKDEFRFCIGQRPASMEYYEGLYNTCMKSGEWDQVAYALEKMFAIDPSQKVAHAYEYGQALFHLNRFDDAIPMLKNALRSVDLPDALTYIPKKHVMPVTTLDPEQAKLEAARVEAAKVAAAKLAAEKVYKHTDLDMTTALSYQNAIKSECILLAEYQGYDKSPDIGWNHPPQAHYYITEILKGPPLNKHMPVKYEFHDVINPTMPKGWKFDEKKCMPEKDSKWIMFIEFAVPKRGMFEMYQGSYGIQPANDDNLNKLYALLDKYNMRNTHS